ncbi:hypothetical protein FisN_16Hu179 [Fistulifera solaris]|uniref:DUF6824 domain-containing protein n=1 Tax=Fistulifera solaris TaxID=1519565 RepID=A0A1Z5KTN7_FISSO|nr:hypothetical protein FisN_16Hu179 [Fistulifera solaris]|eukprot:GAX29381.1 hypothetical protein FisN_16Hu179 [Fistulifera solaris]
MKCKPDDEQGKDLSIDQVNAKRQSEDDEDSSVAMVEEMLSSEYDTEEGGNLPAEHAPHPAPHTASHPAEQDLHPAPQPAKRWKKYPLKDITEPHEHDVLCGRGGHTNKHEGNKKYRKMVEGYKEKYIGLKKKKKTALAKEIVYAWKHQDPPGRFLKQDETGKWFEVVDKIARGKTSQALREKKPTKGKALREKEPKQDEFGDIDVFDEVQLTPSGEEVYLPNADFTAWVEPYSFATGNALGTTVSAPLYDRTKSPHHFLGVLAIDIALKALNRALETDNSTESIAQDCPTLELTQCELDSYRAALGGEESRCLLDICSADDLVETIATQCTDSSKHPDNLLANEDAKELSYEESTCCVNNNATDTGVCVGSELYVEDKDGLSKGAIAGIAVGGAVGLLCLLFVCFPNVWRKGQRRARNYLRASATHRTATGSTDCPSLMDSFSIM